MTVTVSDGELTDQATITVNLNDDREEDADGDGLTQAQEEDIYGTSDTNADTDGDGYEDGAEVTAQVDPADPNSFPNEAPVIANQSFSIEENAANGTTVGTIAATDANQDAFICTITKNKDPNQDGNGALRIEGNKLLVNDSGDLDFEEQSVLQVTITVSDGELTDQATITVNLTDDREEDADGDGLTQAQEEDIYGTSDANADTDDDGYTDSCEILFKSSPNNTKSVPAFQIKMNVLEVNQFELLFPGKKGVLYSVQTSDDMKTWLSLEKLIIGQGDTIQEIFSFPQGNSGHYWRVRKE
ncbi:MAG: cadherin repeat domain-containing protein [Akkermansiaceae bacterium]|nr:cadherin repeat domain-containing protein [Akkermansiaceae bacterium]